MIWVQYLAFGVSIGAAFALVAVGIVVVYRASGVLNFAHASIGVAAAYTNFELMERTSLPVGVGLAVAIGVGALLGLASHLLVFGPLGQASQTVKLIVSFGLSGVIQGLIGIVWSRLETPVTRGNTVFSVEDGPEIAGAVLVWQRVAILVFGIALSVAIAVLLKRTSFGIQLRALAQNPVAAQLAGVDDRRVQGLAWAISGATAALAAVLLLPFGPVNPLALNGLLIKSFGAALLGGFVSLPASLVGGLALGIGQELLQGFPAPLDGLRTVLAPLTILALLFLRVERFFVSEQEARAVEGDERLFASGVRIPFIGTPKGWLLGSAAAAVAVLPMSGFWAFVTTRAVLFAVLALSLVILTGWTGQVSLMAGTFAGVGTCFAWVFDTKLGFDFLLTVPLAALATIPVCALAGLAALRLRPLYLAVATLALAGLFDESLFRQDWFANGGETMTVTRPGWLESDHRFAVFTILASGLLFAFAAGIARGRTGRAFRMVRDNPLAASAGGVNPVKYRLLSFALSAAYAGAMGALFAYLLQAVSTGQFSFFVMSLTAFGLAAVGGIRSPLGAVIGAFAFVQLTEIFRSSGTVSDFTALGVGAGIVVVVSYSPDGLVGVGQKLVARLRGDASGTTELIDDTAVDPSVGTSDTATESGPGTGTGTGTRTRTGTEPAPSTNGHTTVTSRSAGDARSNGSTPAGDAPVLEARDITVRFGGNTAVDRASVTARPGEIVGLIGPNGAGKTTLLNAISGFVPTETGEVELEGRRIDHLIPYQRARIGLGRSFQDARLWPTLTVREALLCGFHAETATNTLEEGMGLASVGAEEERIAARAAELLGLVDLDRYLDNLVSELSFGTTRAVELAWLAARDPVALLLDEPASGLQQSEVRALGGLVHAIRGEAAVIVIDHDVPFVSGLADRMVALHLGVVIAEGSADEVLSDDQVLESYLGTGRYAEAPA